MGASWAGSRAFGPRHDNWQFAAEASGLPIIQDVYEKEFGAACRGWRYTHCMNELAADGMDIAAYGRVRGAILSVGG